MKLRPETVRTLEECSSIHQPNGFHTICDIRTFWFRYGARGFLNIQEVTPAIVREIREQIIEERPNE